MRCSIGLLAVLACGSGCATILAPGPDIVVIDSVPRGAAVTVDGEAVGYTPATVVLQRTQEAVILVEKPGFIRARHNYNKDINPVTLANILIGGLPGIIVDAASRNIGRYGAGPLVFRLNPMPGYERDDFDRLPLPADEQRRRKRKPCPARDPEIEKLRPPGYVSPEEENCEPVAKDTP